MPYNGGKGVLGRMQVGSRTVVAVTGVLDNDGCPRDWAAYEGGPDMDVEQICAHGYKLQADVAVLLFPEVTLPYRR